MKKILWSIGFATVLASLFFVADRTIFAAEEGANDGVDLKFKIEGSTDNGATWVNFSGTDFAGGQTITASPGDRINWRVKIWNEGPQRALNIDNEATYVNNSYFDLSITDMDLDGDEREYDGGDISQVNEGTSENTGYQGVSGTITLKNSFPEGQTAIVFGGYIADYTAGDLGFAPMRLINRAIAAGVNKNSAIRIVVNVASTPSSDTATINSTSATAAATLTVLPQTGR